MAEKYSRNPRKRVIRGSSADELRQSGRRRSEELTPDEFDMPFVRLGSSAIGTGQDVVQRIGNAIIGGDFSGNARGEGAIDIQIDRRDYYGDTQTDRVASGLESIAFGRSVRSGGDYSMGFGAALVDADSSVGLGSVAVRAGADRSSAVGTDSGIWANSFASVLLGDQSVIHDDSPRSILIGGEAGIGNTVASPDGILLGTNVFLDGMGAVAIGAYSLLAAARGVAIGYAAKSVVDDQAVIAATAIKMQTALVSGTPTYESVITTADTPTAGNLAAWTDSDGIEDAGVSPSSFAASTHAAQHTNGTDDIQSATASQKGLMTAAYASKLDGIEAGATADQTAAEILTAIKTVDGTGSGLDADLLDGEEGSNYARTDIAETFTDDVIVEGDLTVDQDANVTGDVLATGIVQAAAAWISGVAVSLNAKLYCGFNGNEPYETTYTGSSTGHRGQVGTESGGVIYRPGKFGKAVQIAEATTNILLNPTFESAPGTFSNAGHSFWGSSTGTDGGQDSRFAGCVLRWTKGSGPAEMLGPVFPDYTSGVSYTFSFWARSNASRNFTFRIKNNGSPYDSAVTSSTLTATTEWQRFTATLTMTSGLGSTYRPFVVMYGGTSGVDWIEIAEFQVEQKSYATPLCAGHLGSGHSWSGTAHASMSSRTAAALTYSNVNFPARVGGGDVATIMCWANTSRASGAQRLWHVKGADNNNNVTLSPGEGLYINGGWRIGATGIQQSASEWVHWAVTFDFGADQYRVYKNGTEVTGSPYAGGLSSPDLQSNPIRVGYGYDGNQFNGLIDDFAIISRALSADEIRAIYESNAQLICS